MLLFVPVLSFHFYFWLFLPSMFQGFTILSLEASSALLLSSGCLTVKGSRTSEEDIFCMYCHLV